MSAKMCEAHYWEHEDSDRFIFCCKPVLKDGLCDEHQDWRDWPTGEHGYKVDPNHKQTEDK